MERILARAWGLRTRASHSAPGTTRSSTYLASPDRIAASSRRRRRVPSTVVTASPLRAGRGEDGLDDVVVAGAAAQVPLEALADVGLGRVGVLLQERHRRHHHAGGAVAALEAVVLVEGLLHRVEVPVGGQALDGGDAGAVGLHGEHRAA